MFRGYKFFAFAAHFVNDDNVVIFGQLGLQYDIFRTVSFHSRGCENVVGHDFH